MKRRWHNFNVTSRRHARTRAAVEAAVDVGYSRSLIDWDELIPCPDVPPEIRATDAERAQLERAFRAGLMIPAYVIDGRAVE